MSDQLPDTNNEIPRVVVAERVIDKMLRGALLYPEPETGEALIGLVVSQTGRLEPDIYVMDTIGPGDEAVRHWGMFEQGSDWQEDVFNWLHDNWEAFRELRRPSYGNALAAKWDVPLMHVGDWHKQPGDMTEPSTGDEETARRMITDAETPVQHVIAPIVTMYPLKPTPPAAQAPSVPDTPLEPEAPVEPLPADGTATVPPAEAVAAVKSPEVEADNPEDMLKNPPSNAIVRKLEQEGWIIRVDFWYMSGRNKRFMPVTPAIYPNDRLPGMPPISWHLLHPKRFEQEFDLFKQGGYIVSVLQWDADGRPPYEMCFSVYKPGAHQVFVIVTSVDYPVQMPAVRLAPLVRVAEGEDVFEKVYSASKPVLITQMPDWPWDSKRTLIELVWHLEKTLKEDEKV